MTIECPQRLDSVGQALDDNVMHAVIDNLDDSKQLVESLLQVGFSADHIGGLHQVLGQELVFGQTLHWFEKVRTEGELVAGLLLAVTEDGGGVLLTTQVLHCLPVEKTSANLLITYGF